MNAPAWRELLAATPFVPLTGSIWRVVESQEDVATMSIVDNVDEQTLLEEWLETSKPAVPGAGSHLHYLLHTPFRYPPLRDGTRFGTRTERSLFYASRLLPTALAETAWYRLCFFHDMTRPLPSGSLSTQHTAFSVSIETKQGLRLSEAPFIEHDALLRDRQDLRQSQALGAAMREHGVQAFEYRSVRDPEQGINVALFSPEVFAVEGPEQTLRVLASTRAGQVEFVVDRRHPFRFRFEEF